MSSSFFDLRSTLSPATRRWPFPRMEQTTRAGPANNRVKHCNNLALYIDIGGMMGRHIGLAIQKWRVRSTAGQTLIRNNIGEVVHTLVLQSSRKIIKFDTSCKTWKVTAGYVRGVAYRRYNTGCKFTVVSRPQTYMKYNPDAVPPIHFISNHETTDKLTTQNGGTFTN